MKRSLLTIIVMSVLMLSLMVSPTQSAFGWGGGGGGGGGSAGMKGPEPSASTSSFFPYTIAASEGQIFVVVPGDNKIRGYQYWSPGTIYDKNGNLVTEFGSRGINDGQFQKPKGIDVSEDKIFVADSSNYRIQVFDLDGNFLFKFGSKGSGNGQFDCPQDIKFYKNQIYVVDSDNHRIQIFDINGNFIAKFGSEGKEDGELKKPYKFDIYDDKIFIVEPFGDRIQVFDLDGNFLFNFGSQGNDNGELKFPEDIIVWEEKIFVTDLGNNRIQIFDINGNFVTTIGPNVTYAEFERPHSIAVSDNKIFVADSPVYRVQIFEASDILSSSLSSTSEVEYDQIKTINPKMPFTLDVGIHVIPEMSNINEEISIRINFLQPNTQSIQEHVDYRISVSKDDNYVFEPIHMTHTSTGSVTIPVKFSENGLHDIDVDVGGFLFSAFSPQTVSFTINVGQTNVQPEETSIPDWIKNNAGWWAEDQISDSDFVKGIEYMIQNGIIKIEKVQSDTESSDGIPPWIKNNAEWWSKGLISDNEFIKGIEYLVKSKIIKV